MSIFFKDKDVYIFQGDSVDWTINVSGLKPNTDYRFYLEISQKENIIKIYETRTNENGKAHCIFSFDKEETEEFEVKTSSYAIKACHDSIEDTIFPTPFTKGLFVVKAKVVEGDII